MACRTYSQTGVDIDLLVVICFGSFFQEACPDRDRLCKDDLYRNPRPASYEYQLKSVGAKLLLSGAWRAEGNGHLTPEVRAMVDRQAIERESADAHSNASGRQ